MRVHLWAIRHKPTGHCLPEPTGRMGRGGSHTEPSADLPPRLFRTELGAKRALTAWLRGKFTRSGSRDWETGLWEEDYPDVTLVAGRRAEDMEIVHREIRL